jgi:two-component system response regulator HydG
MLKSFLTRKGFEVVEAFSFEEAVKALRTNTFDVVLSDFRLPDKTGLEVLREVKEINPATGVIIMTGYADIRMAVNAIKLGAHDYVAKPINPDEILLTINSVLENSSNNTESVSKKVRSTEKIDFIEGTSESALQVKQYVSLVAPTNLSVIIQGDSGTGKEYVARRIHAESLRKAKPFVAIDCGALSKDLALSEFFGHIKGSFTGAVSDKVGQFEVANGGTLFLDEIGNLSYEVQVNLLRAIQERKIKRIGDSREIKVDVRIIAASNEDLKDAVREGGFREDLYHRLNEFTIQVDPLRERLGDLNEFASYFLSLANRELNKQVKGFDPEVIEVFRNYSWPGNIRELRNVVRRAVLIEQGKSISVRSLPTEIAYSQHETFFSKATNGSENLKDLKEKAEQELILSTLQKVRYNKSKAAKLLNIDRKTLYNKMRQYGLSL